MIRAQEIVYRVMPDVLNETRARVTGVEWANRTVAPAEFAEVHNDFVLEQPPWPFDKSD